jgi:hypothetical protein
MLLTRLEEPQADEDALADIAECFATEAARVLKQHRQILSNERYGVPIALYARACDAYPPSLI